MTDNRLKLKDAHDEITFSVSATMKSFYWATKLRLLLTSLLSRLSFIYVSPDDYTKQLTHSALEKENSGPGLYNSINPTKNVIRLSQVVVRFSSQYEVA